MEDPHKLSELPPIQSAHLLRRLEGVIFNHCGAVFSDKNTEVPDASLLGMAGGLYISCHHVPTLIMGSELRNMVYHAMRTEEWKEIDDEYQQQTLSRPKLEVLKLPVQQKTLLPLVPERLMVCGMLGLPGTLSLTYLSWCLGMNFAPSSLDVSRRPHLNQM